MTSPRQAAGHGRDHVCAAAAEVLDADRRVGEHLYDLVRGEARPPVQVRQPAPAGMAGDVPVRQRRGAQARAGVPGGRLHEHAHEPTLAQEPADRHAVERHAAGQAQVAAVDLLSEVAHLGQQHLLQHRLDAAGQVHGERRQLGFGLARRMAQQLGQRGREHALAAQEVEVLHGQAELAVVLQANELAQLLDVPWTAIGREPHHLVLAIVDLEAEVGGDGAVEQAQRAGELHLLEQLDVAAPGAAVGRGRQLAHGVDRQDGGVVEV